MSCVSADQAYFLENVTPTFFRKLRQDLSDDVAHNVLQRLRKVPVIFQV